jgi:hypothetical protein
MDLWTITDGVLALNLHPGQTRAWESERRFVAILAGSQGGKTSYLPWWLWRETDRCGAGDYLAVTASYDLFKLKFLPAMREVFEHVLGIGRYWSSDRLIELADPKTRQFKAKRADDPMWGRIILRSAESGGGLESATAKAAILDEAGQGAFTIDTWQAVMRRLTLSRGRVLIGTTIYNLGWLKQQVYDKAMAGHPDYDVIQFDSTENPTFPVEEFEAARESMPAWKFNMFYRGRYERPAGLIYDSFIDSGPTSQKVPRFAIPDTWERYLGLDFGGVNTAGLFYAEEPGTGRLYLYREYKAGGRTAAEHAAALLRGEPMIPRCVGGSKSEDQWRDEFAAGGLPVDEPDIKDVEVGIDRVYGVHKRNELHVFDDLDGYLNEKLTYSRKVDENGEPTEDIERKSTYHFMDAERYILGWLRPSGEVFSAASGGVNPALEQYRAMMGRR